MIQLPQSINYQNKQLYVLRCRMDRDADASKRQHAASNHYGSCLVHKMIAKLIHVLLRLASLLNNDVLTVNIQERSQHIPHFLTPNPFARVHKGSRLVSDIHQHLLNLFSHSPFDDYFRNGRNAHIHVVIQRKEREKALQRAIRAAPAFVVQSLMSIVEIENVSTDQPAGFDDWHGFVRIAENARND